MGVAGLRRTHEGDHQNAERGDHLHPYRWLLTVLSALEIALHLVFRASICLAHPGLQAKPGVQQLLRYCDARRV